MKTLIIVGHEGMLGRMLMDEADRMDLKGDAWDIKGLGRGGINTFNGPMFPKDSIVINAAGIVKERHDVSGHETVSVNAALPHLIAGHANVKRLIQVSTDCVFDGKEKSPYTEADQPKPLDLYGRSKLAGELLHEDNALTVRTSFIGFGQRGLVHWLLNQPENATIESWTNWIWNGYYVRSAAKLLLQLAIDSEMTGLLHLEGIVLTKGELLGRLATLLRPDMTVIQTTAPERRWMVLGSHRISGLGIPSWQEQWDELKQDAEALGLMKGGKG